MSYGDFHIGDKVIISAKNKDMFWYSKEIFRVININVGEHHAVELDREFAPTHSLIAEIYLRKVRL